MSKLRALLVGATAAGALAAASFAPAFADPIIEEDGVISIESDGGSGGSITLGDTEGDYLQASGTAGPPPDGDICGAQADLGNACLSEYLPA